MTDDATPVTALERLAEGDRVGALAAAAAVAATGSSRLADAVATYLRGNATGSVYDRPAAFAAFIRGGGNVALYQAVTAELAGAYDRLRPTVLLDIGCGDGTALVPALAHATHRPARLDLVEPSPMLTTAIAAVGEASPDLTVTLFPVTAEAFAADLTTHAQWPLAESTFALHTLPYAERSSVLSRLRDHVGTLIVVEFDVPDLRYRSHEHLRFLAETYERGLAEYGAEQDLVAQGFLMPVLAGQLVPGATRVTWEQPALAWKAQLEACGYAGVTIQPLVDYWSAPAFVLTAEGTSTAR